MKTRIFISLIEVVPLVGSELDPSEICGAAVRCYIPAGNEFEARERLAKAVAEIHCELVEIEFCAPADGEWQKKDNGADAKGVAEAESTGRVAFDDFFSWGYDAPDAMTKDK